MGIMTLKPPRACKKNEMLADNFAPSHRLILFLHHNIKIPRPRCINPILLPNIYWHFLTLRGRLRRLGTVMTPTWNCVLSPSHPARTDFPKRSTQFAQGAASRQKASVGWSNPIQTDWRINKSPTHDFDIFFPPRAPRTRDQLRAHQQPNSICNELRCLQKVEGCKSERKVASSDSGCEAKSLGRRC